MVWRQVEQEAVNIWTYFYLKWRGVSGEDLNAPTESISGASFCIVFHSNCGSILFSFGDMTMGRITDRRRTNIGKHRDPAVSNRYVCYTVCLKKMSQVWLAIALTHIHHFFRIFGTSHLQTFKNRLEVQLSQLPRFILACEVKWWKWRVRQRNNGGDDYRKWQLYKNVESSTSY